MAIQIGSSSLSSEDLKLDSASRFRIVHIQQATIKAPLALGAYSKASATPPLVTPCMSEAPSQKTVILRPCV